VIATLRSAQLSDVCRFQNGGTPSKSIESYFTGEIPWITGADLVGPVALQARSFITEEAIASSATNQVSAGTVLLVTRTSVGKVAIAGMSLCFSQDITALTPDPKKLDAGYLVQFLRTREDHFAKHARGATIQGITRQVVADLAIPLPTLEEQRRIAAILDQAETLRTQRRAALAQLDSLSQTIFLDMFGDPVTNPKGWVTQSLQKVCGPINDCPHSTPDWTASGVICLRTSNLTIGGWNWADTRYVSEVTFHERSKRGYLVAGDIVLSREGTVGIAGIVHEGMELCMGQRLVQVRPAPTALAPEYLLRHLLYVLSPARIGQLMVGSTSQHLNVKELRALRIPIPPLPLQQTFATRIQAIESLKATHSKALAELDALFASLQQRAFAGEL